MKSVLFGKEPLKEKIIGKGGGTKKIQNRALRQIRKILQDQGTRKKTWETVKKSFVIPQMIFIPFKRP